MTNRKSTKRALLGSVMAMVLCMAMLVGATFAWFTDTASTGVNKIQAGKLDVALEMKDASGNWVSAEGKTLDFVKAADAKGEAILWEPGCTYTLPELRVVNNGNLALKYKVIITGIQGSAKLNEAIEWTIGDVAMGAEQHLAAGESNAFTIKGHMKESAGNEYMNESIDGIAITVVATQDTVESDSFDKDYDAGAEYPVVAVANVNTNGDTVLKDKEEDHTIQVTVPAGALDEGVQSLKLEVVKSAAPAGVQVASTESSQSYEVTMKDQNGNAVSTNGTLMTVEMNVGKNRTALKLYHDGEKMTNDIGTLTDAADHYVYDAATGYVTMKVSHFSPFTAVFARDYWTDHAADGYATPVDTANKVVTVSSAEELALFAKEVTDDGKNYSGYTLDLANDVDLGEYLWKPINGYKRLSGIVVNGNGHTIRNMKVRGCTNSSVYGVGFIGDINGAVTVKDIAFDGADVFFVNYAKPQFAGNVGGIVLGYTYGTTLFENVSVTNSSIWGYGKIGILLGMGADPGVKVTFKDCVSKNNTIHAAYDMGGLAGMIQRGNGVDNARVENCTVENITVDFDPSSTYVDVKGTATLKSNDQPSGTDMTKAIDGKYLDERGYYWCAYGDYYVSYGNSSYDAPVEGYRMRLANSEYCVNK
ncbi:MAG: right-handed parallel beta-helix repeat-containing protein [Oscillospiraceae bacterium]|jgi:predicted ribosomally synthesized peptide with SipW-like signal peptide|uniref:right-handed parallel beta-helix repeat-containing protein n=1 Tax=Vescimonas sp. TaxID=2892404 RepID=UPI0030769A5E